MAAEELRAEPFSAGTGPVTEPLSVGEAAAGGLPGVSGLEPHEVSRVSAVANAPTESHASQTVLARERLPARRERFGLADMGVKAG